MVSSLEVENGAVILRIVPLDERTLAVSGWLRRLPRMVSK
jgi:hypothetical protein